MSTQALWSSYHEQLHSIFTLDDDPFPGFTLEMVEISDLHVSPQMASFSVMFHGAADSRLEQHIYRLQHPILGSLNLFLVPVGGDSNGFWYEAVFNQLTTSS